MNTVIPDQLVISLHHVNITLEWFHSSVVIRVKPPFFLTTEQELFHFLHCGVENAVRDPPPAAGEGRGGAAIGSHTGQGV